MLNNSDLDTLRSLLPTLNLDGYLVPTADAHHAEWVMPSARRLAALTGFQGSAGTAVVLPDRLILFTDGRYTDVASGQIAARPLEVVNVRDHSIHESLARMLPAGFRLGYDPWLHTVTDVEQLGHAAETAGYLLIETANNPIDRICAVPPSSPVPAYEQPLQFTGTSSLEKRQQVARSLISWSATHVLISSPESVCWLLNVRGDDNLETPLLYAFAILHRNAEVDFYVDFQKISPELRANLGAGVRFHRYESIVAALSVPGSGQTLAFDPASTSQAVLTLATAAGWRILRTADPCLLPKALKTDAEIAGARNCQRREGALLCVFWHWLETALELGALRESQIKAEVDRMRSRDPLFRSPSFETIPASGPNAALPHYHVTATSDRILRRGEFLLLDSGGQYRDGTTDITRTFAYGEPTMEMRRRYTLVLKSFIRAAAARFPPLTRGIQIDAVARELFWRNGVDFDHSLGHGVGSFLGVHEGPNRLRPNLTGLEPLQARMITSIEPAFYAKDRFGVRIENLALIAPAPACADDELTLLHFEQLTLCPIDLRPVILEQLSERERSWLNDYHARVRQELLPRLSEPVRTWLITKTSALPTVGDASRLI